MNENDESTKDAGTTYIYGVLGFLVVAIFGVSVWLFGSAPDSSTQAPDNTSATPSAYTQREE